MLQYPNINPVALKVGSLKIYWYGVMYVVGIALVWLVAWWRTKQEVRGWSAEQVGDLIFYCALGLVLGGRLGYCLFYQTSEFLHAPWTFFYFRQGGMSFHGGLLGVLCAFLYMGHKHSKAFLDIGDFIAPMVPLGLACGRVGNFINGELWGRVTNVPWGMVFPHVDSQGRHPSQLYEFVLEGFLLFVILFFYSRKIRPQGAVSGLFLLLYGVFRFFVEFYRMPDPHLGFIALNWLTMGQLLSIPMIMFGIGLLVFSYKKNHQKRSL